MEIFHTLPDPRKARGIRHPLPSILALTVLSILAGHSTLEAIAQFGRDHGQALAFALGFRRAKTPTKSALSKLFRRLDIDSFEAALSRWLLLRQEEHPWQAIAIDGKTLRGTKEGELPGVHLLSAFVPAAATVIAQMRVDSKTNEPKAALQLLGILPLEGKVLTSDAMFTHRDFAQQVCDQAGQYILFAKDNQPLLKDQIRSALREEEGLSPLPTPTEACPRGNGSEHRQRTWSNGISTLEEYDDSQRVFGLAPGGTSL